MALEIAVDHRKDDVRRAIMEFAIRQGYRANTPWYLDGLRVEARSEDSPAENWQTGTGWKHFLEVIGAYLADKPHHRIYVDIELERKRSRTVVSMEFGESRRSESIAMRIRAHLIDEASFLDKTPVVCPSCTAPVANMRASYC